MRELIYFDYAATTPVDPRVAAAMSECLQEGGDFANPASISHALGRRAHARVERARAQVAALIGAAPAEIVFTSGSRILIPMRPAAFPAQRSRRRCAPIPCS
jgi:cysteine desulfurase